MVDGEHRGSDGQRPPLHDRDTIQTPRSSPRALRVIINNNGQAYIDTRPARRLDPAASPRRPKQTGRDNTRPHPPRPGQGLRALTRTPTNPGRDHQASPPQHIAHAGAHRAGLQDGQPPGSSFLHPPTRSTRRSAIPERRRDPPITATDQQPGQSTRVSQAQDSSPHRDRARARGSLFASLQRAERAPLFARAPPPVTQDHAPFARALDPRRALVAASSRAPPWPAVKVKRPGPPETPREAPPRAEGRDQKGLRRKSLKSKGRFCSTRKGRHDKLVQRFGHDRKLFILRTHPRAISPSSVPEHGKLASPPTSYAAFLSALDANGLTLYRAR